MDILKLSPGTVFNQMVADGKTLPSIRKVINKILDESKNEVVSSSKSDGKGYTELSTTQIYNILQECCKAMGIELDVEPLYYVMNDSRIIFIRATAGAGKTTMTCLKIHREITFMGVNPKRICMLSFAVSSKDDVVDKYKTMLYKCNMATRRFGIYCDPANIPNVRSLNSLTYNIAEQFSVELGIGAFNIINYEDSTNLMSNVILNLASDDSKMKPNDSIPPALVRLYDYMNETMLSVDELSHDSLVLDTELPLETIKLALGSYRAKLKTRGLYHHSDTCRMILEKCDVSPSFRNMIENLYDFIVIDEAQDVSRSVLKLIGILINTKNRGIIIGDDDQSIYGFKGALTNGCQKFAKAFPDLEICYLSKNRRCPKPILEYGEIILSLVQGRVPMALRTDKLNGVLDIQTYTNKNQVNANISNYLKTISKENLGKICIGYRKNTTCIHLVNKLLDMGVPFRIKDDFMPGTDILSKSLTGILALLKSPSSSRLIAENLYKICGVAKRPKDLEMVAEILGENKVSTNDILNIETFTKYIEEVMDKEDIEYFYEIPSKYLGLKTKSSKPDEDMVLLKTLSKLVRSQKPMIEVMEMLFPLFEKNYWNFMRQCKKFQQELEELILANFNIESSYIDMRLKKGEQEAEIAKYTSQGYGVQLSTFHSLKGTEYDEVFLIELEGGVVPLVRISPNSSEEEITELINGELRLLYVGVTRAKSKLHVYWSEDNPSAFTAVNKDYYEKINQGNKVYNVSSDLQNSVMSPDKSSLLLNFNQPEKSVEVQETTTINNFNEYNLLGDVIFEQTPKQETDLTLSLSIDEDDLALDLGLELTLDLESATTLSSEKLIDSKIIEEEIEEIGNKEENSSPSLELISTINEEEFLKNKSEELLELGLYSNSDISLDLGILLEEEEEKVEDVVNLEPEVETAAVSNIINEKDITETKLSKSISNLDNLNTSNSVQDIQLIPKESRDKVIQEQPSVFAEHEEKIKNTPVWISPIEESEGYLAEESLYHPNEDFIDIKDGDVIQNILNLICKQIPV